MPNARITALRFVGKNLLLDVMFHRYQYGYGGIKEYSMATQKRKRAILYCRVSTDKGTETRVDNENVRNPIALRLVACIGKPDLTRLRH